MSFKAFLRREPVLCAAALAALVSCFFVPPDREYLGYVDMHTIVLLYCLMCAVAGLCRAGVFTVLAHDLCVRAKNVRQLGLMLVLLCFFSSMLITNDVSLLIFVPFAITVLGVSGEKSALALVVVLQTLAANLGSMLTPFGNPQNIHLFSYYGMGTMEFLSAALPVCAVSFAAVVCTGSLLKCSPVQVEFGQRPELDKKTLWVSAALFVLCLPVVFRVLPWYVLLPVFVAVLLVFDRQLLRKADFCLLLTFVCFFVFVGNVGRIGPVREALRSVIGGQELLVAAGVSQLISNVPAAVLLSGFTDNSRALLLGVNIGGLGTPVASLASLISLKLYSLQEGAEMRKFMKLFSLLNFGLLAVLLLFGQALL